MQKDKNERRPMDAERRNAVLEALANSIVEKRKDAISGRLNSGIEAIWVADNEFYEGYDDANRHEFESSQTQKPTEGGQSSADKPKRTGSTLFPNITGPYVDTAAAKIGDMLMGVADWRNFKADPTPIPDIVDEEEGFPAVEVPGGLAGMPSAATIPQPPGNPAAAIMANPAAPGQMPPLAPLPLAAPPIAQKGKLAQLLDKVKAIRAKAVDAAKNAELAIEDALVECQYHDEMRDVIHDAARLGTGVIKGPFPEKRVARQWKKDPATGEYALVEKNEMKPASKRVSPDNLFPDYPACGENIHNGNHIFEFDPCTEKQLIALMGGAGPAKYLDDQIKLVLDEGPNKANEQNEKGVPVPKGNFPRWYYYGVITGEEMEAAGCECDDPEKRYPVIATLVNDRIIKIALNPMETNDFPYDVLVWKKRRGMPWGMGVARQGRVAQRMVTAATRNLMDNAGAASRPHKVITDAIQPGPDPWTWEVDSEASTADVRSAMSFFIQPSLQGEMDAIIARGERMMEMHTGLPMIILGMQGAVQETAHGRTLQNNNGSTVLRRIARNFDTATESHVRRYHAWLMLYSKDEGVKGDFVIKARASSALVERDLQSQHLPMIHEMSKDPANKMSRVKTKDELLRSIHFDPRSFDMTDEEKAEIANAQPPKPYQVAVAEINAANRKEIKAMDLQHDAQDSNLERELKMRIAEIDARLATEELSEEARQEDQKHKVNLASLVMELRQQRELSPGPQVRQPPTEPVGRAPNGMAFPQ